MFNNQPMLYNAAGMGLMLISVLSSCVYYLTTQGTRFSLEMSCFLKQFCFTKRAPEINFRTPAVRQGSIFRERSDAST